MAVERQALVEVALGRIPADVVIKGGTVVDVCTRRLLPDTDVAVHGSRIALVGEVDHAIGPETMIVYAEGLYLAPGLIDAHYHIESSRLSPRRHAQLTLPHGTTSIFEDSHEICNALGLKGVRYMLDEARGLPQKIYVTLSSATPPTPYEASGGYIGGREAAEGLSWDGVVGVGEVMDYTGLFKHEERLWKVIQAGLEAGKVVEGHGTPSPPEADALLDAGVSSTHFKGSADQAVVLLERGMFLELKPRVSRDAIRELAEMGIDWQLVGLCVDDRPAEQIKRLGHLDYELRIAIEEGLDPLTAYQLATINNARHWHMEQDIGMIAPGRYADILFISDLEEVSITRVMANGQVVAEDGMLTCEIQVPPAPDYVRNSIRLPRPLSARDFEVRAPPGRDEVEAIVLRPWYKSVEVDPIVEKLPVRDGLVQRDLAREINKVAIVNRSGGGVGVSFWKVGYREGAVATSILHDSHNISVIGATDEDMAFAVNRVAALEGGIAVVKDGQVLAEVSLPIGGLMTDSPPDEVIDALERVNEEARGLHPGSLLGDDPVDAQTFIFLTCHPWGIVLTDKGLINVQTGESLPAVR